jgi:hypothetical protein
MIQPKLLLLSFAAFVAARSAQAQYYEARNTAMGGAGTASSHYLAAGWANPALLTRFGKEDDFGFLLPTVGAAVQDETDLLTDIQDFVDEYDRLSTGGTPTDYQSLATRLQSLSGRQLVGNLGGGMAFAMPSEGLAWSLHVHSYANVRGVAQIDPADVAALNGLATGTPLPTLNSKALVLGAGVTEVGLSLAHKLDLGGLGLSLGATPKYQRVDTYNYVVDVNNFDKGNYKDSQFRNDDGNFNVDLGASLELPAGFTFGLMARDLIANDYKTVTTGEQFIYQITPNVTVGAAWRLGMLTLTGDVDVTKQGRFSDQSVSLQALNLVDDVQFARIGAELDLAKWVQLRAGLQYDIQNELSNSYSAGLGFSPFDVFHFDVAGIYSGENSYGAVAQFGFTF